MNKMVLETTLKVASGLMVVVMVFFGIGVLMGLTGFYVGPISSLRYAAFWTVVALPIIAAVLVGRINFVWHNPRVAFVVSLIFLIVDFGLIQFANGRW